MKRQLILLILAVSTSLAKAQVQSDTLFIEKTDGSMYIIPQMYIEGIEMTGTRTTYILTGYNSISMMNADIKGTYRKYPYERPHFESFKFNNKFNDQLFTDASGEIDEANGKVTASVGCIGKRLTPSFKLPDGANAYIDGVLQESKKSRPRFDDVVHYTVAYPNQTVYKVTGREPNSNTTWMQEPVTLTADMFSTNAKSNYGEDPVKLLDNDETTFFHSTWGSGNYTPLPSGYTYEEAPEYWPYLQIDLYTPLQNLIFSYTTRGDTDQKRGPLGFILQGSNNGYTWTDLRTFTQADDDLPTGRAGTYTSPIINLSQSYSKLRLQLTYAQYKNYLAISEFALYSCTELYSMIEATTQIPLDLSNNKKFLLSGCPNMEVELPYEIRDVQFKYTTRYLGDVNKDGNVNQNDVQTLTAIMLDKRGGRDMSVDDINRDGILTLADITALANNIRNNTQTTCAPQEIVLRGSKDGYLWYDIETFTELPTEANTTYTSPEISLNTAYKYLSLWLTSPSDQNGYFNMSDLKLYQIGVFSQCGFQPYGKDYDVEVEFLTDHATSTYNVPRVDIWFGDGVSWDWGQYIDSKEYYYDATIKIDGAGVFPDMEETTMQIRGRGNSSWGYGPDTKNPYRLKFETKVKPFGMTKGKSWVLLANKQYGSMTTNALAMKVADMVESRGCNHIIPCELYINNQYRGSYNFTEKVGFSNNSIDLPDETNAVRLELDSYPELHQWRDAWYNLYVNLKEPDLSEEVEAQMLTEDEAEAKRQEIITSFNTFTEDTYYGGISQLDVDAFVRAMLVNDLVRNEEYKHPKSWFLYNTDYSSPNSLWTFGPVWDFDWSYGYDNGNYDYFIHNAEDDLFSGTSGVGVNFFRDLLRTTDTVKRAYYLLWKDFMESGKLDELIEYCDDYYEYAQPSLEHNSELWGDGNNYKTHTNNAKSWLRKRANYIYNNLQQYDE